MKLQDGLNLFLFTFIFLLQSPFQIAKGQDNTDHGATKLEDFIIYEDDQFYSSFPSIVKKVDGEYLLAFRRAPNRKGFGENGNSHVDPNSYLVGLRSLDGRNWSSEPELIYAHPFGGSQDPCLIQLKDGSILCASYGWAFLRPDAAADQQPHYFNSGPATFLGGYLLRSTDWAKTWQGPIYPPSIHPEININPLGNPIPVYNRGAMYEGKDGRIFWVVAASDSIPKKTSTHLVVSEDKGLSWTYHAPVAVDDQVSFNEASIYETPQGDLVAFVRTAGLEDHAVISRSSDGGKSFQWQSMGFKGHPLQATQLPDKRVLLVYGYRHSPYGIRARILNEECSDFETAPEIIIREDGVNSDIGYPWAVVLDDYEVLVTYYFNLEDGTRHIAGSILQLH